MAPTPFTAATANVGGMQAVSVTNGSVSATIALMGATLLRWSACVAGQQIDLVDGYIDQIEFDSQDGVRNGITSASARPTRRPPPGPWAATRPTPAPSGPPATAPTW